MSVRSKMIAPSILVGGLIILIVSQVFNHAQAVSMMQKAATRSYVSRFLVANRQLVAEIERGLGFGKPIELFSGTDRIFTSIKATHSGIEQLAITDPEGKLLYSTRSFNSGAVLRPSDVRFDFSSTPPEDSQEGFRVIEDNQTIWIASAIYFNLERFDGVAWLSFSKELIAPLIEAQSQRGFMTLSIGGILSIVVFTLFWFLLGIFGHRDQKPLEPLEFERHEKLLRRRVNLGLAVVLFISLGSYSFLQNDSFTRDLVRLNSENVTTLANGVSGDLRKLLGYGLSAEQMTGFERLLAKQIENAPEIDSLALVNNKNEALYYAGRDGMWSQHSQNPSIIEVDDLSRRISLPDNGELSLIGRISSAYLDALFLERLLDALTILLVSLVFSLELLLALKLLTSPAFRRKKLAIPEREPAENIAIIRFTAFLFFLAELLPLPFLPLFVNDLSTKVPITILNLSEEAVNSLPFSTHLIGVMLFIPIIGFLAQRFKLRTLFVFCTVLLGIGNTLSAFAADVSMLLALRFISGLGYGGVLALSAGLVVNATTSENRTTGFSHWSAGFAAASICAVALGGVIVGNLGFRMGLIISGMLSLVLILFILIYHAPGKPSDQQERSAFRWKDLVAPFRERSILAALIFASIPAQLAFFGLFQYTLPLTMHEAGISEANIGRILTIYGLISLGTPLIARMSDRLKNERVFIILGNLLTGIVLCFLFIQASIPGLIITIAAIGIGGMMVDAVLESYLSMGRESRRMGEIKFLAVFSTWEKLITVFIPTLAGTLMAAIGYMQSAALMGGIIVGATLLFVLFSRNLRKVRSKPSDD